MKNKRQRPPKPEGVPATPRTKHKKSTAPQANNISFVNLRPDQHVTPDLTPEDEALIGRLIVRWSRLEGCIHSFLWACLDLSDPVGRIVTARHDAETNIATMTLLGLHYLPPDRHRDFKLAIKQIKRCQAYRNTFAHATWARVEPEKILLAVTVRKPPPNSQEMLAEFFTARRIGLIVNLMQAAIEQIAFFATELHTLRKQLLLR